MTFSPLKLERRQREAAFFEGRLGELWPDGFDEGMTALDVLCGQVAAGMTLRDFVQSIDVRYTAVSEWLQADPDRQERYQEALRLRELHSRDTVFSELMGILKLDITGAFRADGTVRALGEIPPEIRRTISGIEVHELWEGRGEERRQTGVIKKLRFWSKEKSAELLAKHLRMIVERHELEVKQPSLAELLAADDDVEVRKASQLPPAESDP